MNFKDKLFKFGVGTWSYLKIARIELIVILLVIVFDLVTKTAIAGNMYEGQTITLIPKFLHITFVINTKAAFGSAFGLEKIFGDEGIRIFFLVITGISMVVFAYLMYRVKGKHLIMRLALALIIAGGMGNFIDRLFLAGVRDFIEIEYFGCNIPLLGTSFAIFNFADAALTVGVVMFLVFYLFLYKDVKKDKPSLPSAVVTVEPEQITQENAETDANIEEKSSENMHE